MQTTPDCEEARAAVRETYGRIDTDQPSSGRSWKGGLQALKRRSPAFIPATNA